jgi:phenylalanine-4-hydroxylase
MHIKEIFQLLEDDFSLIQSDTESSSDLEPATVKLEGPLVDGDKNVWRIILVDEYDRIIKKYSTHNYLKAVLLFCQISEDRMIDTIDITNKEFQNA